MTQSRGAVNLKIINRREQISASIEAAAGGRDNALKTGAEAPVRKELKQLSEAINI